jgi:transcriptional regulator with XRE-family HTH domain
MLKLSRNSIFREEGCVMQYGERIKQLRKDKGITQDELGNMVGKKQNQISEWENGKVSPSPDDIVNICKAFDINLSTFYGFKEDEFDITIEYAKDKGLTPEEAIKAIEIYLKIFGGDSK